MRKDFQLDLLSALALGGGMAPPQAPPSLEVDDRVLEVVIDHTRGLILGDQGFRQAVAKALELKGTAEPEAVSKVVNSAADLAAAQIRQKLAGQRVEGGTWAVVETVLRTVLDVQAKTYLNLAGALEGASLGETPALEEASARLKAAAEVREMAKLLPREAAGRALEVAGRYALRGMDLRELRDAFAEEVHWQLLRAELEKGRQAILAMCRSLLLDGRLHRFEIGEVDRALTALEEREIPRDLVLAALERLVSRWNTARLKELNNPWR